MTHTIWLITYESYHSYFRTSSNIHVLTVQNGLSGYVLSRTSLQLQSLIILRNDYVIMMASWRHQHYYSSFIAHFSEIPKKLIFVQTGTADSFKNRFFKILFPYFPFSSIIFCWLINNDSSFWFCWLTVPPSPIPNTNKSFATLFIYLFLAFSAC